MSVNKDSETKNERLRRFYAIQTLYYWGEIETLSVPDGIRWSDFTKWILNHTSDPWIENLPIHPDAIADLKSRLE